MELCRGITGFRHLNDPPLPICDLKAFHTHCHDAARLIGGRVLRNGPRLDNVVTNFVMAVIELADGPIAVLLNCHFPVVGFAIPARDGDTRSLQFVDCEGLANLLNKIGEYEVLSRDELEKAVSPDDLQRLLPAEIDQAHYWKPRRVGDVVFNFWD